MKTTHVTSLLVAFLAAPLAAQKGGNDTIRRTNGQVLRKVEVLSESLTEVKYKTRSKEESLGANEVREIEWGDAGDAYSRALFAASRGDHANAANLFQETADRTGRAALKAAAAFRAGQSLYMAATSDVSQAPLASRALTAWLGANPTHRKMPAARNLLGMAWLLAGSTDEALGAFKQLEKDAGASNLGPTWIARAKFGQAQALVKKKDFSNARSAYVSASATLSTVDPTTEPQVGPLMVAAKVGEGECYVAEKRYNDARTFFDRLSTQAGRDAALAAAARCGAAQATFEDARAKKNVSSIRSAQVDFARVSATDLADGESTAKALYYLGQTILALGKDQEGSAFAARADAMFRNVIDEYPNSRWAVPARQALLKK